MFARSLLVIVFAVTWGPAGNSLAEEPTVRVITFHSSTQAIELKLLKTRAVLCPQPGERVLESALAAGGSDIQSSIERIQWINFEKTRQRDNLGETPKESPLFQRYLKTLEEQEKEMDDLQAKLSTLLGEEAKTRAAYDDILANLSAE